MMNELLQIKNLSKHFDGIKAVDQVSFSLDRSSCTGIHGENGAGKTTLFNLISGFEIPDDGQILLNGKDVTHKSVLLRAKGGLGRLFQSPRVFNEVSVLNNLLAASKKDTSHHLINYIWNLDLIKKEDDTNREKANKILDDLSLGSKAHFKAHELSVGERKLLSLGSLIMNDAKLILLDEPFSGINLQMIEKVISVITGLIKDGHTFIVIEHNHEMMMSFIDKSFEMINGKLISDEH